MGNLNEKKKSLLDIYKTNPIRKKVGEVIIFNIMTEQQEELLNGLLEKSEVFKADSGLEEVKSFLSCEKIKALMREFTNIELVHEINLDEYSDEEIIKLINLLDFKPIYNEIVDLYIEHGNSYYKNTRMTMEYAELTMERFISEIKIQKMLKDLGIDLSEIDLDNITSQDFQKIIEDKIEKQNKLKKPQDHKQPIKPRQKRKSKKDKEEVKTESDNPIENILDIPQENLDAYNAYQENLNDLAVKHGNDIDTVKDIVDELGEDK